MYQETIYENHYQGMPLSTNHDQFLASRLDDALATIDGAMAESTRLVMSCYELYFPTNIPYYFNLRSNEYIEKFLSNLQRKARRKQTQLANGKRIVERATIDAIWQKNCTQQGLPYYRVCQLLNRAAYYKQNEYYDDDSTLQFRTRTTWANVVEASEHESGRLVRYPGPVRSFIGNTAEDLIQIFPRVSILCTVPLENNGQGFDSFGTTRKAQSRKKWIH